MVIQRKFYLDKLIDGLSNRMIKIVTGIRRSGKSFLLFELFHQYLVQNLTDENHIIEVALDDRMNKDLRDPDKMLMHIRTSIKDAEMHYILLDEVQMMDDFVDVLNSLLHIKNVQVYVKDILERHKIRNQEEFAELLRVVASIVGSKFNAKKISDTFKSAKQKTIDRKTIAKYLEYMSDAFIVEQSRLYNIRGKSYINTLSKYYFQDIGLRNALLNFRQIDAGHIMENIIYNELRMRGYRVDVGQVTIQTRNKENKVIRKDLEVDFVVNQGNLRLYIQSCDKLPDIEKVKQESASLKKINDFFKRIIIVNENIKSYWNEDGIYVMNLYDFLLDLDSLTKIL